jgi:hypothetical protein
VRRRGERGMADFAPRQKPRPARGRRSAASSRARAIARDIGDLEARLSCARLDSFDERRQAEEASPIAPARFDGGLIVAFGEQHGKIGISMRQSHFAPNAAAMIGQAQHHRAIGARRHADRHGDAGDRAMYNDRLAVDGDHPPAVIRSRIIGLDPRAAVHAPRRRRIRIGLKTEHARRIARMARREPNAGAETTLSALVLGPFAHHGERKLKRSAQI